MTLEEQIKKTDEELIRELQNGSKDAFDELVERFSAPLLNFIARMIGDYTIAEDLLQETFIRLWVKKDSYREIAKFSTWLYTVAGNLAKSELRRRRFRRMLPLSSGSSGFGEDDDRCFDLPDPNSDPEKDHERRNIQRRLDEEISKLPVVFKEIIILRDIQELSYEEISTILKIPLGTVKSRVNRARGRLQESLKDLR
ncbi:sigma-70 family RNA polymerase sigma factor [bacterium]|nr:sigma-70 family RNA polymerase sigma factor [bacterium]